MALDYAGGAVTDAFKKGTSGITGGGFGSFSGGSFSAPGGGGMPGMTFGVGEALSLAQLGFSVGKAILGDKVAEQKAYNQAYSTTFNNAMGQFRADKANEYKIKAFEAKLDFTRQQIENNYLAAQSAWTAEQVRLNELYGRAAFKSQAMRKMLLKSMGSSAAREVYGKSARRGALLSTLGNYGRSRAQLTEQLMSENRATQMRMGKVEQQKRAQDKLTIAQTSVMPQFEFFSPSPVMQARGGGIGQALGGVLGAGLEAFDTGWSMTPTGGDFFGIAKKA
jgi:hypothetical protein